MRACVRNVDDDARVGFLEAMNPYASGRLTLHAADLDEPGCFDDIFRGCDAVAHVSHVSTYDDPDYVRRTCDHIISSIERSESVRRVVVTSSLAAIISEADITELARRPIVDEDREPDESNPKRTPERGQGYSMGKVIAQHAFSDAAAASGRWDAITVCPSDNVGPILSPHHKDGGPWQHLIERMVEGRCEIFQGTGPYRPWMTVDVRDDAACHIGAARERQGRERRALPRDVDGDAELRGHLHVDRPRAARAAPRPGSDRRPLARPVEGARGRVPFDLGRAVSCATTASGPLCRSRSARSTTRSATASSHCSPSPTSSRTADPTERRQSTGRDLERTTGFEPTTLTLAR